LNGFIEGSRSRSRSSSNSRFSFLLFLHRPFDTQTWLSSRLDQTGVFNNWQERDLGAVTATTLLDAVEQPSRDVLGEESRDL
jgi:hypothetical protein